MCTAVGHSPHAAQFLRRTYFLSSWDADPWMLIRRYIGAALDVPYGLAPISNAVLLPQRFNRIIQLLAERGPVSGSEQLVVFALA